MSFVVVVQSRKLADGTDYPVGCVEFQSLEQAHESCPGKDVWSVADYRKWHAGLVEKYPVAKPGLSKPVTKKWWQFWRKA